jgi:hypothetical protein
VSIDEAKIAMFDKFYDVTEQLKACRLASERLKVATLRFNSSIAIVKILKENRGEKAE